MKKPFNTYTNRNGQTLPKSATISSSPEILNWLKENFHFAWANAGKLIDESKPYIVMIMYIFLIYHGHLILNQKKEKWL